MFTKAFRAMHDVTYPPVKCKRHAAGPGDDSRTRDEEEPVGKKDDEEPGKYT